MWFVSVGGSGGKLKAFAKVACKQCIQMMYAKSAHEYMHRRYKTCNHISSGRWWPSHYYAIVAVFHVESRDAIVCKSSICAAAICGGGGCRLSIMAEPSSSFCGEVGYMQLKFNVIAYRAVTH